MIVYLHWKFGNSRFNTVESVKEVKGGLEVKCFGNDPVVHKWVEDGGILSCAIVLAAKEEKP